MCYHNLKKPFYEFKYRKREDILKPTNEILLME